MKIEPYEGRRKSSLWRHYEATLNKEDGLWYLTHKERGTVANTKRYPAKGFPTKTGAVRALKDLHRWY